MTVSVAARHYLGSLSILLAAAAAMAGIVVWTATWISLKGISFWVVFAMVAALHVPPSLKRMAESIAVGRQGREKLLAVREEYLHAVVQSPSLRAWPESTWSCLMAACSILLRAGMRSWLVLVVAVGFLRLIGGEFKGDLGVFWSVFMVIETILVGARAYLRGTLPVAGMGIAEMEAYFQERINRAKDGYLIRNP